MVINLPPLVERKNFLTDEDFIEALYIYFTQDFISTKPKFQNQELMLKRFPLRNNKEATFYHITTIGKNEKNRKLDIPRAERLRWIKPLIESNDPILKIWENNHKNENNILIYYEQENFLIVLRKRKNGIIFWTSFYTSKNYKKDLLKEYNNYQKTLKTPSKGRT